VILGLNDGLVSMFLLLLGVSGGGAEATEVSASDKRYCHRLRNPGVALLLAWLFPRVVQVLLAGITGALAGAISMGLSEYIGLWPYTWLFVGVALTSCAVQQQRAKKKSLTVI
jgi:hypothetical protein